MEENTGTTAENKPEEEKVEEAEEGPTMFGGLKSIGIGILIFGVAYYFFITMTAYESGEGISMNRILFLAYSILGKYVTVGLLGLLGVFISWTGINEINKSKKVNS